MRCITKISRTKVSKNCSHYVHCPKKFVNLYIKKEQSWSTISSKKKPMFAKTDAEQYKAIAGIFKLHPKKVVIIF